LYWEQLFLDPGYHLDRQRGIDKGLNSPEFSDNETIFIRDDDVRTELPVEGNWGRTIQGPISYFDMGSLGYTPAQIGNVINLTGDPNF